jgi:deoxyribose-phosphate aldolase
VEDKETLKTGTVVSQLSDSVEDKVNNFLTNGVVTTGVVVGSILLTRDQLLRVVKLSVSTSSDFVKRSRL